MGRSPPGFFHLFGLPDQRAETTHAAIKIPHLMGIIATRSLDEQVTGLKDLKAQHEARIRSGMLAHEALEAMRADGSNQAAAPPSSATAAIWATASAHPYAKEIGKADEAAIARRWRTPSQVAPLFWELSPDGGHRRGAAGALCRRLPAAVPGQAGAIPQLLLRALLWSIPLPWIAIEAGWFVAEFGRQPWTISDVLPVSASVSPAATRGSSGSASSPSSSSTAACWWWVVLVASCDPQRACQPADGSLSR